MFLGWCRGHSCPRHFDLRPYFTAIHISRAAYHEYSPRFCAKLPHELPTANSSLTDPIPQLGPRTDRSIILTRGFTEDQCICLPPPFFCWRRNSRSRPANWCGRKNCAGNSSRLQRGLVGRHPFQVVAFIKRARGQSERFVRAFRKAQRMQDVVAVADQFRPSPLVGVFEGAIAEFTSPNGDNRRNPEPGGNPASHADCLVRGDHAPGA